MRRDILLLNEMTDAAEQAYQLSSTVTLEELARDRQRSDALLWNFTVLGEAAAQLSIELKERYSITRDRCRQKVRIEAFRSSAVRLRLCR